LRLFCINYVPDAASQFAFIRYIHVHLGLIENLNLQLGPEHHPHVAVLDLRYHFRTRCEFVCQDNPLLAVLAKLLDQGPQSVQYTFSADDQSQATSYNAVRRRTTEQT
jgi:hypothetical protein